MGRRARRKAGRNAVAVARAAEAVKTANALRAIPVRMGFAPIVTLVCADADGSPEFSQPAVQLVPAGRVDLADGDSLVMDSVAADQVIAAFNSQGVDVPVDIDHATVHRAPRGELAPAQGWIKSLAWDPAAGLTGRIEWTAAGGRLVHHEHYRYLSPVVLFDSTTKRVRRIHSAALTNKPAIKNMGALKAASEIAILQEFETMTQAATAMHTGLFQSPEQLAGEIKQLLIAKGVPLAEDSDLQATMLAVKAFLGGMASDADAEADADTETEEAVAVAHIASDVLKLGDDFKTSDVVAGVESLAMTAKTGAGAGTDLAALHERVETLQRFHDTAQASDRVKLAVDARKLNPNDTESMKAANAFAARNPTEFENWTKWAPVVGPPRGSVLDGTGVATLAPTAALTADVEGADAKALSEATAAADGDELAGLATLQAKLMAGMEAQGFTKAHCRKVLAERHPKIFS